MNKRKGEGAQCTCWTYGPFSQWITPCWLRAGFERSRNSGVVVVVHLALMLLCVVVFDIIIVLFFCRMCHSFILRLVRCGDGGGVLVSTSSACLCRTLEDS